MKQKIIVIKYGGAAMAAADLLTSTMEDIALLQAMGCCPVIVHGGGPEISSLCKKLGIESQFTGGLRVTDAETMAVVQMVLAGRINVDIVGQLQQQGVKAVGLSGKDGGLLKTKKHLHQCSKTGVVVDLGFVGDVSHVDTALLTVLLSHGYVPVIAPIGLGAEGESYNINADTVAGQIAAALQAEALLLLTDVEGVRLDPKNPASKTSYLSIEQAKELMILGKCEGGMLPKIEGCLAAVAGGVSHVQILDGRIPHTLLLALAGEASVGTKLVKEELVHL